MVYRRAASLPRVLVVLFTTALVSAALLLALASPASARVVIVPGTAQGGATETFAIRVANERSDVDTTRVELTFPTDLPIPFVEVTPAEEWTATIEMRPLDEPITVDGQEVDEAVASIVWEGGSVAPHLFEQFLVTAGPLPPEGQLVFAATQGYADGTVEEWTDPAPAPNTPSAPTIDLLPQLGAPTDSPPQSAAPVSPITEPRAPHDAHDAPAESGGGSNPVWMLVLAGLLVAFAVWYWYRRPRTTVGEVEAGDDEAGEDEAGDDDEFDNVEAGDDDVGEDEAGDDEAGDDDVDDDAEVDQVEAGDDDATESEKADVP